MVGFKNCRGINKRVFTIPEGMPQDVNAEQDQETKACRDWVLQRQQGFHQARHHFSISVDILFNPRKPPTETSVHIYFNWLEIRLTSK